MSAWSSKTMPVPGREVKEDFPSKAVEPESLVDKTIREAPYSRIISEGHVYYHPTFGEAYRVSMRINFPHIVQILSKGGEWETRVIKDCDIIQAEKLAQQNEGWLE